VNVSLSLDAWTSNNGHAFLAIVMHWINSDWKLGPTFSYTFIPVCSIILTISEELLIDFHELVGEYSGENFAHVVYNTLNLYGVKGHVSF